MSEKNLLTIRTCIEKDKENWILLNREFMAYEIQDAAFWNNADLNSNEKFAGTFDEALQNPQLITLLIIEKQGKAIGFANLMTIFSIWSQGKALILDDLYIREAYRKTGIGSQVMHYIEEYGKEHEFKRLQFQSEHTNPLAHKFYTGLGYNWEAMNFYVRYL